MPGPLWFHFFLFLRVLPWHAVPDIIPGNLNLQEEKTMGEKITLEQGQFIAAMARAAIAEDLSLPVPGPEWPQSFDRAVLQEKKGVFATLHKNGRLRGCIGTIEPVSILKEAVCENARAAAFRDSRFAPLTAEEFPEIDIEVSVLTTPRPLDYEGPSDLISRLVPGKDGVVLKKGFRKATFLPQVWEQLPTAREFLSQLCMKAGLAADAWEITPLEISTYRVQCFRETEPGTP